MKLVCTPTIISPTVFKVRTTFEEINPAYDPMEMYAAHKISELVIDTQEKAIRAGLIALGWTPPDEVKRPDEVKNYDVDDPYKGLTKSAAQLVKGFVEDDPLESSGYKISK